MQKPTSDIILLVLRDILIRAQNNGTQYDCFKILSLLSYSFVYFRFTLLPHNTAAIFNCVRIMFQHFPVYYGTQMTKDVFQSEDIKYSVQISNEHQR